MIRNFDEWVQQVALSIRKDALWSYETYRKALFLADLAWVDVEKLIHDPRGKAIGWQLLGAAGSVPANIEEGFGRGFGKDYGRFLKIALGSARETRGWYYRGRHLLDQDVLEHRFHLTDDIIAGLVITAKQQYNR